LSIYKSRSINLFLTLTLAALWFRSLVADLFTRSFGVDLSLLCFKICGEKDVKSNAITVQAWTGPESSRRLRFPDFVTIGT